MRELIRVLNRIRMKEMEEILLELLTYEPFGKFLPEEEAYIREILSWNDNPPQAKLQALFLGFCYYFNYIS